jgi:hypothetical protein
MWGEHLYFCSQPALPLIDGGINGFPFQNLLSLLAAFVTVLKPSTTDFTDLNENEL